MATSTGRVPAPGQPEETAYQAVFGKYHGHDGELISILVDLQEHMGYISEESLKRTAGFLKLSENYVFGVASFFSKFRFDPPGRTCIKVCMGTACHVHGGGLLSDNVGWRLGVGFGQATRDGRFDFQRVNCLGCCALAPVVKVDEEVHARTMVTGLKEILDRHD